MVDEKLLKKYEDMDKDLENNGKVINFMLPLSFDLVAKSFFKKEDKIFRMFLNSQLKDVIHINFENEKNVIRFSNSELIRESKNERGSILDFLLYVNDKTLINIEFNTERFRDVQRRNWMYIVKVIVSTFEREKNAKDYKVYQFNINFNKSDKKYGEKIIDIFDNEDYDSSLNEEIGEYKIITENVAYYRNLYYNEHKKLSKKKLWLLAINMRKYAELYILLHHLLDNEKIIKRFMERMIKLNNNDFVLTEAEARMLDEVARNDALRHATEDGIKLGVSQGKKENQIEIIKNMLKDRLEIKTISKYTGLSEKEIKNLEKSFK